MNVVDSSGWLEYLANGPNAGFFSAPIQDTSHLFTPTICLYEVCKRVLAQYGEERALEVVGAMSLGILVDLSSQIAVEAAWISIEYKLAMADSLILASARAQNAVLWTQDAHFQEIEGVKYIEKR
jgi:predicted nucleic acid-binding protein